MGDYASEILDSKCDDEHRLRVIARVASQDTADATTALIKVAQADAVNTAVSQAAGRALAQVCFRRRRDLDDLVMADMTADAYLAYDGEIARLLDEHPETRMARGIVGSGR